tara:strand:+ start:49 stop:885 length:837 start_codon:yes stop_codon:yes gene_type:complete
MKNFKTYKEFAITEAYSDEDRMELADKGFALSDGSYPIKDLKDLKNAIQAYGRAKDQARTAKFIVKRAKALGAEDLIPDTEDFQKSLGESVELNEAKDDYVARFKDTNIFLKKGYKHLNDDELLQLYLELGELISDNKLKVKNATLQFESVELNEAKFTRLPKKLNAMWELKNSVDYIVGKYDNGDDYNPAEMKTIEEFIKKIKKSAKSFKDAEEVKGTVYESVELNESASSEEKRIVMLAVRKIAKYRSVPIDQSVVDVQRAAEELEQDIKKGKIKK